MVLSTRYTMIPRIEASKSNKAIQWIKIFFTDSHSPLVKQLSSDKRCLQTHFPNNTYNNKPKHSSSQYKTFSKYFCSTFLVFDMKVSLLAYCIIVPTEEFTSCFIQYYVISGNTSATNSETFIHLTSVITSMMLCQDV